MGAAGGGAAPSGQFMLQGYYSDSAATTVTYDWTVPDDVTSISAVCVGGGEPGEKDSSANSPRGGDGGDLRYVNDIAVTPGETLQLGAAIGWEGDGAQADTAHSGKGGPSWLKRGSSPLVFAEGGNTVGTNLGTGVDGTAGGFSSDNGGHGGGAGGYTSDDNGNIGSAGNTTGRHGSGIGLTGNNETTFDSAHQPGAGGGYGYWWNYTGHFRGMYGGGGGGNTSNSYSSNGAPGGVRIIWGDNRSFPSNAQGVFPTAAAGTELSIKWMCPAVYDHVMANTQLRFKGLEIFDDTGTNLVASSDNGAGYDGMPVKITHLNSGSQTFLYGIDPPHNGISRMADFDDLSAGETTVNWAGYSHFTKLKWEQILDTDYDSDISLNMNSANHLIYNQRIQSDEDQFLTGENHHDTTFNAEFLFKFASAKVIKKIHFYMSNQYSWVPRCKITLDGNVIADDAAHFIDPDTDEGHNSNYIGNRLAVFEFT